MDAVGATRISALIGEDLDWIYLSGTALLHGVAPLLCRSLQTTCPEAVPRAVLDHFQTNAGRDHVLTDELLKLLTLFEAQGIPVIPYKGPVLAALAYGDLALREFHDLDILMPQRDILRARDLLISQGYQPAINLSRAEAEACVESHHDYELVRDDGLITVELQWGVTQASFSFPLMFEHLWERRERVSLAGTTILNLSPEDLLLILCVHGSKHIWRRLAWICDVAELIRAYQGLDWERVMKQASRLGGQRMLLLGLSLAMRPKDVRVNDHWQYTL